eukprot:SM000076S21853  [mRNA]  locus=s76:584586:585002:+ [translate_table: standard]
MAAETLEAAGHGGGGGGAWPGFEGFGRVQALLDHNRLLIAEIRHNHEARAPDGLARNVPLIRELNQNVVKIVELYAEISKSFTKTFGTAPKD